jgi:hypothetical protein
MVRLLELVRDVTEIIRYFKDGVTNAKRDRHFRLNIAHRCPLSSLRDCGSDGDVGGRRCDASPGGNHLENGISLK